MTTPSPGSSVVPQLSNGGPNRTMLQKLLEEINGEEEQPHLIRRVTGLSSTPRRGSLDRSDSVWVATSTVARDARDKLRALDEARYPKRCIDSANAQMDTASPLHLRRQSTHGILQQPKPNIW